MTNTTTMNRVEVKCKLIKLYSVLGRKAPRRWDDVVDQVMADPTAMVELAEIDIARVVLVQGLRRIARAMARAL